MAALLATIFLTLTAQPARACVCIESGPACQAFSKTDAVFDATVSSIELIKMTIEVGGRSIPHDEKRVHLVVRQAWKGADVGPLDVLTPDGDGMCGYDFKDGGRYLIFAYRGPSDGQLHVSRCTATREFNGTGDAADFLASLAGPARGGRVFGRVTTSVRTFNPERTQSESESATETLVHLYGGGQERTVLSTGGGYEFGGLTEGPYRLELEVPDGYTTYSPSREVQIPSARACAQQNYWLSPAGRIVGRAVGKDNRGLAQVHVEVADPDARAHPVYGLALQSSTTDADGYFEVRNLPPGRYIVGVNLRDLPNQNNRYARTVFPGGESDPQIITLSLGQTADVGSWELPPPLAAVKTAGTITWKDGTPAGGVYVWASDLTGNPVERARAAGRATSAPDGRFVLELREGRVYTFVARDTQSVLLPVAGPRLEIGAKTPAPLVLVIQRDPPRQ